MRRATLALLTLALLAGCVAPSGQPTPTETSTSTATPTPVTTEYAVSVGSIPDEIRSVEVTLRVVFVEREADIGPCWRETFDGPYKPTTTPIAPPSGECYRSETVSVDLTDLDGERSLGTFRAPGRFDAGHALVATNVTARHENGSVVTGVRGASGKRLSVVRGPPTGPSRVTLSIESYRDRPYDYWFVVD
ncbi:hypothetical protein [Haloplanus sp. C73]|uniref:hypothetical protein n=1 Tax=Haloplanus sp. C73 TaxID=3421641 RepID=UPI003EB86ECB